MEAAGFLLRQLVSARAITGQYVDGTFVGISKDKHQRIDMPSTTTFVRQVKHTGDLTV